MLITFEQIKHSGKSGLEGAICCAFPGAQDVQKEGLTGLPCGSVVVDGIPFDWLLKAAGYTFMPSA